MSDDSSQRGRCSVKEAQSIVLSRIWLLANNALICFKAKQGNKRLCISVGTSRTLDTSHVLSITFAVPCQVLNSNVNNFLFNSLSDLFIDINCIALQPEEIRVYVGTTDNANEMSDTTGSR